MTLRTGSLAARLPGACLVGDPDIEIAHLTHDSRQAAPGSLFAAIPGLHSDGREYAAQAIARGAAAVLLEPPLLASAPAQILVRSAREALPSAAEAVYGRPDPAMPVVGITGTNGKTTVAFLVTALLEAAGFKPALVGSLFSRFGRRTADANNTTPEADDVHRFWADARHDGADALVMEASSHGLLLHRVDRIGFQVGVLTNLTRDHLDYHPDLAAYRGAKTRLFGLLPRRGAAIVPVADAAGDACARATEARVIRYGESADADVRALQVEVTARGITLEVAARRRTLTVRSPLFGRFNVSNLLAAVAVGEALGLDTGIISRGLGEVAAVPGRAERIDGGQPFVVLNDFAHTPDALLRILTAARELTAGKLHVVFGCGGDRDRGKRPLMGEVAGRVADRVTVTSDNPRTEDPQAIIAEIVAVLADRPDLVVEPDRERAIRAAVESMQEGDTLVVAGKGHEHYQIVGDQKRHFDDAEVLTDELKRLGFAR